MTPKEAEFLRSLRATFRVEAEEHLQAIAAGLLALEKPGAHADRGRLIETVFRAAHSLKGAARAVNFTEIETICQSVEELFAAWKRAEVVPSSQALDTVHRALDNITRLVADTQIQPATVKQTASTEPASALLPTAPATEPVAVEKPGASETVRIDVAKLDAHLLKTEEMLAVKLAAHQRAADLRELSDRLGAWNKNGAGAQEELHALEIRAAALSRSAHQDSLGVGKLVDELLEDSKKLLMLPLASISVLLPKIVRDLCRDQNKEADLAIRGEEVEIDKRILEELKDPLIHLLRNCVDHGIETPAERRAQGKPPRASIALAVTPVNGNKVELRLADDGAGVDVEKVKASALKQNLISPAEAARLSDAEALALIFRSEVSSSSLITQLSGRGLGLAIVREKTEKLGGQVSVESRRHAGTTIRMVLPLALSTFRGILVTAAERLFVAPTAQVERVTRFKLADIQTVEGRETLALGGRAIALARLADVLELPPAGLHDTPPTHLPAVVLGVGEERMAFAVDAVLDEQEVLVKPLTRPLVRVRNVAGATVLGSGRVAPILNVTDLLRSARKSTGSVRPVAAAQSARAQVKSLLVAEDSITSRMLLKGILESAGYRVKTAVDGMEAFAALRTQRFDAVISDVEMPRLNGFDLTARIRADKKLAELPVVLVTALESREDRERGIDVGANAYLVKSSFDQSNLLETLRRLVQE